MTSPFDERPLSDRLRAAPLTVILHPFHRILSYLRHARLQQPQRASIRVVCLADTHTLECEDVPNGDLLIHAGDLSNDGSVCEIQATVNWLRTLPHPHKVVIAGNHDSYFDARSRRKEDLASQIDWGDIHYLQHSSVTLTFPPSGAESFRPSARSLTVYGAPQIPAIVRFGPDHAFTYQPQHDAWSGTVPLETDVLVTHTPPHAHLDLSPGFPTGCSFLLAEVWRVRPMLHVFGHIHAAAGCELVFWDEAQRAWERLCARAPPRRRPLRTLWTAVWQDVLRFRSWLDAARVVVHGLIGIVWTSIWGGENRGCGWMVNAACMNSHTGRLEHRPQVILL